MVGTRGAYDLRHVELPALLDGELVRLNPDPRLGAKYSVLYTAYALVAFNRLHRFYTSPAEVFKAPYAGTIQQLFDNNHTAQQVINGTPGNLRNLLTARGFALLRHPRAAGWPPHCGLTTACVTGHPPPQPGSTSPPMTSRPSTPTPGTARQASPPAVATFR